jgi:arsenite methyltransferase
MDRISGPMNRLALAELGARAQDRVLEVGFGGGALLRSLLDATSGQVVGVDVSDAALARARRRFAAELGEGRLLLLRASAEALPIPNSSVDKAVSVNSLYFWPEGALAEIARVVEPGGRLSLCFEPPEELRKWPGHRYGFRLLEVGAVRELMESAGFGDLGEAWGSGRKPDRFCCLSGTRLGANG